MKRGWFVFLFAFSMAYLESAVVYYLRKICCPSGFSFPLPLPTIDIYLIELGRELATLLMILSVSFILGKGIRRLVVALVAGSILFFVPLPQFFQFLIATSVVLYAGKDILSSALRSKTLNMDVMYSMGVGSAYIASLHTSQVY